ncbi:unnamed protein product [Auanema sp. JU1783]|nr:unnamed protein product [Auanema sp. JU1783]
MNAKAVLLINLNIIILISICSDHWVLVKVRQIEPPSHCSIVSHVEMSWLHCPNQTYALVEQHASLFRQCSDLTEGYRRNVSKDGRLYGDSCSWFIFDPNETWRLVDTNWGIDIFNALFATTSILLNLAALQQHTLKNISRFLMGALISLLISIIVTFYTIHLTNTRKPLNEGQYMYYAEAGWSIICACVALALLGIAVYVHVTQHRVMMERRRSQRRRRQIHNAIMSSCKQEIALAIRARMTVL